MTINAIYKLSLKFLFVAIFSALTFNSSLLLASNISSSSSVVIEIDLESFKNLFPADPTLRAKSDIPVKIINHGNTFDAVISAGGQSTLKSNTPNLRVKKLIPTNENINSLANVPITDKSIRINPMTMDNGYVATKLYTHFLNEFSLTPNLGVNPETGAEDKTKVTSHYAHVHYRITNANIREIENLLPHLNYSQVIIDSNDSVYFSAGIHLVMDNPKSLLEKSKSKSKKVVGILRSRYNIKNTIGKLKSIIKKEQRDESTYTSQDSSSWALPYRVDLEWVDAKKGDTKKIESLTKKSVNLVDYLYTLPKAYSGQELFNRMDAVADMKQMFRFLAINNLVKNGDISDEYFWYILEDKASESLRLGIMPQDGDDMFKGAHTFPVNLDQISLILKDKAGMETGLIFNFEDPLFRLIKHDPIFYLEYLKEYKKMIAQITSKQNLESTFREIKNEIAPLSNHPMVLNRGLSDERAAAYVDGEIVALVNQMNEKFNASVSLTAEKIDQEMPKAIERAEISKKNFLKRASYTCLRLLGIK